MPYIDKDRRNDLDSGFVPETPGELAYAITSLLIDYVEQFPEPAFSVYNDCLGALSACTHEFYRRVVVPYEEKKCEENGDVY